MKPGDIVKLAEWCHQPGSYGVIIEVDRMGSFVGWGDRDIRVFVNNEVQSFHPDDFYLVEEGKDDHTNRSGGEESERAN